MTIDLAQADIPIKTENIVITEPAYHFDFHQWEPTLSQMLRGGLIALGILFAGLLLYALFRKLIQRARLTPAYLVALISLTIYFGVGGIKPDRLLDRHDIATLWITRIIMGALVFSAIRTFDRLVIVPLMSRGGKVPVHRFLHQIVIILIYLFAILTFGAWGFGWDIDKFLAGSAVISIVLGLALQETLGNFFSGLVMQASSPFAIGDWIVCAGVEGRVADMTWRAVTIHTLEDNYVIVPNGTIAKELIVNYHSPTTATARSIEVGLEYDLPPAEAVAVLKAAALETHGVAPQPEPFVFLEQFADSAVTYHLKFWISEPASHRKIEHAVRTNLWYRLKQKGFGIPYPIRTVEHLSLDKKAVRQGKQAAADRYRAIEDLWIFSPLSEDEKRELAEGANDVFLDAGQILFRQDDAGESLYIIRKGEVDVLARHGGGPETKVATLKAGDFFGEMSALTGQPRTATIRAATSLACVEINKDDLKHVFSTDPAIMEKISRIIAERNAERHSITQGAADNASRAEVVSTQQKTLFGRMMKFFGGNAIGVAP